MAFPPTPPRGWLRPARQSTCGPRFNPTGRPPQPGVFCPRELTARAEELASCADILAREHARRKAEDWEPRERPPAKETFLRALDALMEAGFIAGPEMRHEASLSPIALLRSWQVDISVRNSRLNHSLRGQATAYGRGLSLAQARASYAMEIVERASAYVSVGPGQAGIGGEVLDRKLPLLLIKARYAELKAQGRAVLDPGLLPLEATCPDAPLYWLTALAVDGAEVLVPVQAVFLFCNLDEPGLGLHGTGLGQQPGRGQGGGDHGDSGTGRRGHHALQPGALFYPQKPRPAHSEPFGRLCRARHPRAVSGPHHGTGPARIPVFRHGS